MALQFCDTSTVCGTGIQGGKKKKKQLKTRRLL